METLWQDLQYGVRMLLRTPGFTVVAVLALALGIGANAAIFSVVNAVLLRPLPFADPERLMLVGEVNNNQKGAEEQIGISPANYLDYRDDNQSFESLAAFSMTARSGFNLGGAGDPERVTSANVSANFFSTLGVNPIHGRHFRPEEQKQGNHRSVMLGHALWQRRFGGDPSIVGQTIQINGFGYVVVGVMPKDFQFPTKDVLPALQTLQQPVEAWVPLSIPDADWTARGSRFMYALGRLKPGVSIEQANADLNSIAGRLAEQYKQNMGWGGKVVSLQEAMTGSIKLALLVLFGAVGFVLLIACANVANLLLARAATRQKEIAIRVALGAGRARLVRQLLTESFILALAGGLLGLLLAIWGAGVLISISPQNIPLPSQFGLDARVVAFTLSVSCLTAVIFGLVPALQASRVDLNETIKEGGGRSSSGSGKRVRDVLVIAEIALAVVLLVGAGLMVRSFVRLENVSPGFEPKNLLTLQYTLSASKYPDDPEVIAYNRQLIERVQALPGVEAVSGTTVLPLGKASNYTSFEIEGRPPQPPGQFLLAEHVGIFADYFRTMRVPVLKGREFTEQDTKQSAPVVIINEAMAREFWPNEDPIGQRIRIDYDRGLAREIVGVAGNVRNFGLDADPKPEMYVSQDQFPFQATFLVVRTTGEPKNLSAPVLREATALDKDQPIYSIRSMEEILDASLAKQRFSMLLMTCFALVASILAAVGLYGVIAYSVTQRTHEIGIRMALGAQQSDILRLIVGHGLRLALVGVAIGLFGAFALTRIIESLLYGVSTTDPTTFGLIALALVTVALLSSFIPARRATKIDPMVALRYE
ncbi:MAG TPA: ABC transporter permease [Pyrinomonadaceae bacterium]|jgi:putative ABC transport system permease protein